MKKLLLILTMSSVLGVAMAQDVSTASLPKGKDAFEVTQDTVDADKINCVGRKIIWNEEETLDFGEGGLVEGLGDLLGGSFLHQVTYTVQYTGIVEKVIADVSVKCIIKQYKIIDPQFASVNYLKYRKYALSRIARNVGKTRVLEMHEFQLK